MSVFMYSTIHFFIIKEYHSNVEVLRNPVLEHYNGNEPDSLTYRHTERPSSVTYLFLVALSKIQDAHIG